MIETLIARPRPAGRAVHQPAPRVDDRADQPRRGADQRGGVRHAPSTTSRRTPTWSTTSTTTRCRSSRPSSRWRTPPSPMRRSTRPSSRSAWAAPGTRPTSIDADGGGAHADRGGPREVPRRRRRPRSPWRRSAIIKPGATVVSAAAARRGRPRCIAERCTEVGATLAREGLDFGVDQPGARPSGTGARPAGAARQLRGGVPAALRRPPGPERRARARSRRGVRRRRRPAGRRPGAGGVRRGHLAGAAGDHPALAHDRARRRPQPARCRRRWSPRWRTPSASPR